MVWNERSIQAPRTSFEGGAAAVLRAALHQFDKQGYAATSVRMIAAEAGLSVSVIYHHFGSKEDLLFQVVEAATARLKELVSTAISDHQGNPVAALANVVREIALFYTRYPAASRVANAELRHLPPGKYDVHVRHRRELQQQFESIINDGLAAGMFVTPSVRIAARTIVVACRDIANWFDATGPNTAEEIANSYVETALMIVGHRRPSQFRRQETLGAEP